MRVLEIGSYIAPAYAGMILAEQGCQVQKWTTGTDPILSLNKGTELWEWVTHGKDVRTKHTRSLAEEVPDVDIVLDNHRESTLERWGVCPRTIAETHGLVWVSLRPELGDVSFDVIAQAQAWASVTPFVEFYLGDTVAGLWMAMKAVTMWSVGRTGHHVIHHATALAKLVEGELIVDRPPGPSPYDPERYGHDELGAVVEHRGTVYREPVRDTEWKRANLHHLNGRMVI